MVHQSGTGIMKIIEKGDPCQHAGLQYEYKKIAHISRRGAIKDARPLPMQHKVFHLLRKKSLSACQSDGRKEEASQQRQRDCVIYTGRVGDRGSLNA